MPSALATLEQEGWNLERWVNGFDSDEESDVVESDSRHSSADDGENGDWGNDFSSTSSRSEDVNDLSDDTPSAPSDKVRKVSRLMMKWMLNRSSDSRPMDEEWDIWLDKERAQSMYSHSSDKDCVMILTMP